jgi:hypothetical protein
MTTHADLLSLHIFYMLYALMDTTEQDSPHPRRNQRPGIVRGVRKTEGNSGNV